MSEMNLELKSRCLHPSQKLQSAPVEQRVEQYSASIRESKSIEEEVMEVDMEIHVKGDHEMLDVGEGQLQGTMQMVINDDDNPWKEDADEKVGHRLAGLQWLDIDSQDFNGRTPLSWAAIKSHEAIVKLLLGTGKVDVDSKNSEYSETPLSWAAENGHEAVVELMLDTGNVDVDSKDFNGQTPLSWAAKEGHEAIVKLLEASRS